MSKRAKRLAKYLEGELGWEVYQYHTECPKCGAKRYSESARSARFCEICGTKLTRFSTEARDVNADIEEAIQYALEEP